ncbi:hypothetical protein [Shinella sp.]|uniref:hypothetical protein n=1 Tax=Shinella sp. TaxID=1870904 RepID=UPI003D26BED4
MARKNVLSNLMSPTTTEQVAPVTPGNDEPRQHVTYKGIGALGAVTRSIDALAAKADAAKEIEAKLTAGEVVIELEPDQIEESFVSDRLAHSDEHFRDLVEAMRVRGQDRRSAATATTSQPFCARCSAIAAPSPREAPVMRASFRQGVDRPGPRYRAGPGKQCAR